MAQKTKITPLGLHDIDEKKATDMMQIMQYVNDVLHYYTMMSLMYPLKLMGRG